MKEQFKGNLILKLSLFIYLLLNIFNSNILATESKSLKGKTFVLAAGHTIYPGNQTGAPNEKDMNILITDNLEQKLEKEGAKVIRPEIRTKNLILYDWNHYMRFGRSSVKNKYVWMEIHGQPLKPYPTKPHIKWNLGVICNKANIYCNQIGKEKNIGILNLPYWNYGVSNNGGIIIEAHHTDTHPRNPKDKLIFADNKAQNIFNGIVESAEIEAKKKK